MITSKNDFGSLTIDDLHTLKKHFSNEKTTNNTKRLKGINSFVKRIETNVAESMCSILGSKPAGLIFDYLDYDLFKNLKIMDERLLNEETIIQTTSGEVSIQ